MSAMSILYRFRSEKAEFDEAVKFAKHKVWPKME